MCMTGEARRPIRDAAQVVPLRARSTGFEVFLFQRRSDLGAFPGVWAFPGGSVDPADRLEAARRPMGMAVTMTRLFTAVERGPLAIAQEPFMAWARPELLSTLGYVPEEPWPAVDDDPVQNLASVLAARREVAEETGWLMPDPLEDGAPKPPAAGALGYIGRLVTPPHERARFNCRFFLAVVPSDAPLTYPPEEGRDSRWVSPAAGLALQPLAPPTRYILERLSSLSWPELARLVRHPLTGTNLYGGSV
jgi:8-oxo-dGTP pyrophosphatase MutT (NUDIX family)